MRPDDNDKNNNQDADKVQLQNIIVLIFIVLFILCGSWIVDNYSKYTKLEKCIEARHRNCGVE